MELKYCLCRVCRVAVDSVFFSEVTFAPCTRSDPPSLTSAIRLVLRLVFASWAISYKMNVAPL